MKFFKEPIMPGCTDYVATGIADAAPFTCLRVTHWDHAGYRGIEHSQFFDESAATPITEAEFFAAYAKALIAFQNSMMPAPTMKLWQEIHNSTATIQAKVTSAVFDRMLNGNSDQSGAAP